jgi:hypothetical protein
MLNRDMANVFSRAGFRRSLQPDMMSLQDALATVLQQQSSRDVRSVQRASEWLQRFRKADETWAECLAVLGQCSGPAARAAGPQELFVGQALLYKCR